jgi:hypothetical protein
VPPDALLERALRLAMEKHREDPALQHVEIAEYAIRIAYPLAANVLLKQGAEEERARWKHREGEDPEGLQDAQAAFEGLLGGIDLHDLNCGIPHPADPEQEDPGCTCGVGAIKEHFAEAVADALDAVYSQGAEEERERLKEARRDTEGVPFLDAARALCPDEAHWEDGGWERYTADASACLDAFLAALDNQEVS